MKNRILTALRDRLGRILLRAAPLYAAALNRFVPGNQAYDAFARHGFHLLRKHYYLPIPDEADLNDPMLKDASDLVGIDMNEARAFEFLREIYPKYQAEFQSCFPLHRQEGKEEFHVVNGAFMAGDAHVYYTLIRENRPRRIIEVGGGNSSLLAAAACRRNLQQYGVKPHLTVVEPYPSDLLKKGVPGLDALLEERIQTVDLNLFSSLKAGDILFIDSSHVLRPGGDVQREYCEILPRLAPGVLVHIHDISLPKPYFQLYFQNHLYWNEQYLLQAFLTYNSRYEIVWPGTYMFVKHPEELLKAFPEIAAMREKYPLAEPSSFWLRVKEPTPIARAA
jgi:Methyltransferase domain